MDQMQIFKQMMDFNKAAFENTFKMMTMLQEQTEKMTASTLEQATWLPAEGKKAMNDWLNAYKSGFENFKKTTDENFKKMESFVTSGKK